MIAQLKIKQKLLISFGVVAVFLIFGAFLNHYYINQTLSDISDYRRKARNANHMNGCIETIKEASSALRAFLSTDNEENYQLFSTALGSAEKQLNDSLDMIVAPDRQRMVHDSANDLAEYKRLGGLLAAQTRESQGIVIKNRKLGKDIMDSLSSNYQQLQTTGDYKNATVFGGFLADYTAFRLSVTTFRLTHDEALVKTIEDQYKALVSRLEKSKDSVESPTLAKKLDELKSQMEDYIANIKATLAIAAQQNALESTEVPQIEKKLFGNLSDLTKQIIESQDALGPIMQAKAQQGKNAALVILVLGVAIIIGLFMFLNRSITKPIREFIYALEHVVRGKADLTQRIAYHSKDELGEMAVLLNEFLARLQSVVKEIAKTATEVKSSASDVANAAKVIESNSEQTETQVSSVSAAVTEADSSMSTVSMATQQLGQSISAIAQNAANAAQVSGKAVAGVGEVNSTVTALGESSKEIGNIVSLINTIAEQTNLLALNATIEAARAGDAGKGFAVVANEVKELAKQTAKATDQIAAEISLMQGNVVQTINTAQSFSNLIKEVNDIAQAIATEVEEQSATTMEISRNISEAAVGIGEISRVITSVAKEASNMHDSASDTARDSLDLSKDSSELHSLVSQFKV